MRNVGWVAAVLISILIYGIGQSDSARAESKRHPKKSAALVTAQTSHWDHNGSLISLISEGAKQKLIYETPRIGLTDAGVAPGTLLFEGQRKGQNITGTAYQFYRSCKAHGYPVSGTASDDRKQIILKGKVPVLDLNCNVTGSRDDTLIFTASQTAPSEPPKDAPITAATRAPPSAPATNFPSEANKIEASKPAVASIVSSAPPAPPTSTRKSEPPAAEGTNAKAANADTANAAASVTAAVTPSAPPQDASKDKQTAVAPPPESKPAPPAEPVKSGPAKNEPPKDAKPPVAAQTAANTPAAANTAAPPSTPAKETQSATAPAKNTAALKSDSPHPPSNQAAAPPSETVKGTQVAAIPEATGSTAKADDAGKSKNAATAVVSAPASTENKAAATGAPEKMMEIVLKNGRILRIGRDIELEALAKIIAQLER